MSTAAKRNVMNANSRSAFNMKDNWNDYGSSNSLSPNRKSNKYQQKNGSARAKGPSFSDAETANGMMSQFNKCNESMATVPNVVSSSLMKSNAEPDCALPNDDSSLMINQDPAIAAIATSAVDSQKDEHLRMDNKQAESAGNASVPQMHCNDAAYQQYPQAYQTENGQLMYGSTSTAKNGYEMAFDGYSTPNHNHQIMQQQYIWQSASAQQPFAANDYASVAAANAAAAVINTSAQQANNGMNMSSPATAYYTPAPSYQSYVYDPAMTTVSYPNMVTTTTTYSPMSSAQAIMSSPQQHNSTALFHTYQTPPPLTKYPHQLYMTPPASGSPSDLLNSNPLSTDRNLDSSTQAQQQQQQPQLTGIYTTASPYMYTPSYLASPPQANTTYQTYQTPIMYSPAQAPQSAQMAQPAQLVHHQPSMLQTPTTAFQNLTINTNTACNTPCDNKYNNMNKFNNNNNNLKANHYSYKKNPMNKSRQMGCCSPMSETPSHMFSPMSAPSPAGLNQQLCFDESLTTEDQTSSNCGAHGHGDLSNSPSMYRQGSLVFSPTSYMSPLPSSNTMPFQQTPSYDFSSPTGAYNTTLTPPVPGIYGNGFDYNHYDSYGDEFVDENEANGGEDEVDENGDGEQLACQICRGRRMCFCYFLKVRYYKFPSFFDLVDHQYKKWRSTMATKAPRKA